MGRNDFTFEFASEVADPDNELRGEAEARLRGLAAEKRDLVGASVAVDQPARGEKPHVFRARVVVFIRGPDLVAVEKGPSAYSALKGALDAAERRVRERRRRRRKAARRPRGELSS